MIVEQRVKTSVEKGTRRVYSQAALGRCTQQISTILRCHYSRALNFDNRVKPPERGKKYGPHSVCPPSERNCAQIKLTLFKRHFALTFTKYLMLFLRGFCPNIKNCLQEIL